MSGNKMVLACKREIIQLFTMTTRNYLFRHSLQRETLATLYLAVACASVMATPVKLGLASAAIL